MATTRERLARRAPYSTRSDPALAGLPDDRPLIVFDGVCVLCSGFAAFVLRHDRRGLYRVTAAQSPIGAALMRHYGLNPVEFETNLLIRDGVALGKIDAFAAIMEGLGWPWRALAVVQLLPAALGDRLYDRIARNRYALFGRRDACLVPPASWQGRVIG